MEKKLYAWPDEAALLHDASDRVAHLLNLRRIGRQPEMITRQDKTEKIAKLRDILLRGEKLFIIKRFASHAGDYRTLDVYRKRIDEYSAGTFANEDLKISLERITGTVCDACGYRYDRKHESLGIGGSGFDAAQEVVERIGQVLYSDVRAFGWQEL